MDHRLKSELSISDVPLTSKGVLNGNVYLRGFGDPSLSTRSYQREQLHLTTASFATFAKALKREGVKSVKGSVLGDQSWFDGLTTVRTWKNGLELESGRISALSGNLNQRNGNRVPRPAIYAAELLSAALKSEGITVKGKPGAGTTPPDARLILRQYSAPLRGLLAHMNKASDNLFAETLLKGLGRDQNGRGSTAAGAAVSEATLRALGIPTDDVVILDGSGLSYGNRLTALGLARLLAAMRQRDDFDDFYDSLAIAGGDGTLGKRMRGTAAAGNAHAKTGSLNVASGLSGYVTSANGHLVVFSILMNGGSVNLELTQAAQDRIVVAIATASLPGSKLVAATPVLRQHSVSAFEPVYAVGGRLKPGIEP